MNATEACFKCSAAEILSEARKMVARHEAGDYADRSD